VEPAGEAVDPVAVERVAHGIQVVAGELLRVVELVVVDQLAEARDGGAHLLDGRRARQLGLVPAGVEAGGHVPEGPDPQ
jgi:hypothetical protein